MKKNNRDDFEIKFFEGVLRERPAYIEALIPLAEAYTHRGEYEKGLEIDRKLSQLCGKDPTVFYNLACSHALLSQQDEAFLALDKAVELGYYDWLHLVQDRDLKKLQSDERFKQVLEKIHSKLESKKRKPKRSSK